MISSHGECPDCTSDQWTFCKTSHRRKDNRPVLRCTRCWSEFTVTKGKKQYPPEDYDLIRKDNDISCVVSAVPPKHCVWVSLNAGCYGPISIQRMSSPPGFKAPKKWTRPWAEMEQQVRLYMADGYFEVTIERK